MQTTPMLSASGMFRCDSKVHKHISERDFEVLKLGSLAVRRESETNAMVLLEKSTETALRTGNSRNPLTRH
jgi:hypothetical protein